MQVDDLKNVGLKVTVPRIKILEIFEKNAEAHFTAEEIYQILHQAGEEVGLATVYRVLNQFATAGLVMRHRFSENHAVYELNQGDHHDHIICINCSRVLEFIDLDIEKRQRKIAESYNFKLLEHVMVLYVQCANKTTCEYYKKNKLDQG